MSNRLLFFLFCLSGLHVSGQITDSSYVAIDSVIIDTIEVKMPDNTLLNPEGITDFYAKLANLQQSKDRKINIVHIGDSHIQADLMTDKVRKKLQEVFGNAGRGFVFPHNLAKTNGSSDIRFSSNGKWDSYRNIHPVNGSVVGLSGIALAAKSDDYAIELNSKTAGNEFNTIKIITPQNRKYFDLAVAKKTIVLESAVPKKITHKIKSGEALSIIADKYNVSVTAIKKLNNLKSNSIQAGKTLKIPSRELENVKVERSEFIPLELTTDSLWHSFSTDSILQRICILPNKSFDNEVLSGLILESNNSGILYHNIGVNGAKFSDYNKYPLFFSQLQSLQPDLIIVSLGTNESFDKMPAADYSIQLNQFLVNVRAANPNVAVIITTPPPSLFQRKYPNTFAADYARKIIENATVAEYAVWDMYSQFGGLYGVAANASKGLIGSDRVHYSKAGYELQGILLAEAILNGLSEFKNQRP